MRKNYTLSSMLLLMLACMPLNVMLSQTTTIVGSNTVVIYSTSTGSPFPWFCPVGVTSIQAECWGGGGSGGGGASGGTGKAGGGGAGGSYVMNTAVTVVPNALFTVTVGSGGAPGGTASANPGNPGNLSYFGGGNIVTSILALGGASGKWGSTGTPSTAAAGTNVGNSGWTEPYNYAGGTGAAGLSGTYTGGGGAGANSLAVGADATSPGVGVGNNSIGGVGANGGGSGASGILVTATNGLAGTAPGGGGSGGWGSSSLGKAGGAGGSGQVIITYVTPGTTAVASLADKALSYCYNGKLVFFGGEVYNSVGIRISSLSSNQRTELSLRSGVYFVKTSSGTQKIVLQ